MSELGPDARSLVDAVLDADEPSARDAARVRAKVDARLALMTAAAVATTVSHPASATAGSAVGAGGSAAGGSAAGGAVAGGVAAGGGAAGGAAASTGAVASAWIAAKIAIAVGLGGAAVATSLVIGSPSGVPTSTPSVLQGAPAAAAPERPTSGRDPSDTSRATRQNATRQEEPPSARAPRPPDAAPARAPRSSSAERPRAARRDEAAPAPISTPSPLPEAPTPDDRTRAPQGSVTRADSSYQRGGESTPTPRSASAQHSPRLSPSNDAPTPGSATVSAPKDSVVEEAALLHAARGALAGGDAKAALALLDEHGARFPKGALVAERQAARVFALCALGRSIEARRAASAFLAQNPRSPLAARVRDACEPPPSGP
jgi:hypothetical protein